MKDILNKNMRQKKKIWKIKLFGKEKKTHYKRDYMEKKLYKKKINKMIFCRKKTA